MDGPETNRPRILLSRDKNSGPVVGQTRGATDEANRPPFHTHSLTLPTFGIVRNKWLQSELLSLWCLALAILKSNGEIFKIHKDQRGRDANH